MITQDTELLFLASPNNPTGRVIPKELLERILEHCTRNGTAVIMDECFLPLATSGESALKYIQCMERLFVVRAYTKLFSLPGVRMGYVVADEASIKQVKRQLPEWNMSLQAQETARAAAEYLQSSDYLQKTAEVIRWERDYLSNGLNKLGIKTYPSDTCFLLIRSEAKLLAPLAGKGILIRDCSEIPGLGPGFYRVAVKAREANRILLDALSAATV